MFGLNGSNYAGSNCLSINPANLGNSKLYLDINIITAALSFDNNYIYIHKDDFSIIKVIKRDSLPLHNGYDNKSTSVYDFYDKKDKSAYIGLRINGPSFMYSKNDHSFALFTTIRTGVSVRNTPYHLAKFAMDGTQYDPQQLIDYSIKKVKVTAMSWAEIGLAYARTIHPNNISSLSVGIGIKRLFGYAGLYINNSAGDYQVVDDSTLIVYNTDLEYGYSFPLDYQTNKGISNGSFFRGGGTAFDFGISYERKIDVISTKQRKKTCAQPYDDYIYKIGFSILDIGRIKFDKNAEKHEFNDATSYWNRIDTTKYASFNQLNGEINKYLINGEDDDYSLVDDEVFIYLPSAVSLQFDYRFQKNIYVNTVFIQSLGLGKHNIHRPTQLAVTPRYESIFF